MPAPMIDEEVERFLAGAHHGYDPYEKRYLTPTPTQNFDVLPHCLHFYYMTFDGAKEDYRHYYYDNGKDPIKYDDVPELMKKLAKNAVLKDYNPPKHGKDFLDIVWRRRCYVAAVIDTDLYKFWNGGGLRFVDKNGGKENKSFFDARDFPITIATATGGTVDRTGFYCINHMKRDDAGANINPQESIFYSYELVFRLGGGTRPWYYDPGGTNQGPPETP